MCWKLDVLELMLVGLAQREHIVLQLHYYILHYVIIIKLFFVQACKKFYDDGECKDECPSLVIYNPNSYLSERNPNGKYAYGATCVKTCPDHLLRDAGAGACVRQCPPDKEVTFYFQLLWRGRISCNSLAKSITMVLSPTFVGCGRGMRPLQWPLPEEMPRSCQFRDNPFRKH